MTKELKIMIGIGVVVIGAGLVLFLRQPKAVTPSQPVDSQSLLRQDSHMTGNMNAKVTVVEFGDFECPACGYAYPIVQQVLAQYKNSPNFNFVFRNFPLTSIHPNARIGAEAAEAAGAQGKYWEMHDLLYVKQSEWGEQADPLPYFVQYAQQLGLNVDQFKSGVQNSKYVDIIKADTDDGNKLGITGTPSFYINGQAFEAGSVPSYQDFKNKIDALLVQ